MEVRSRLGAERGFRPRQAGRRPPGRRLTVGFRGKQPGALPTPVAESGPVPQGSRLPPRSGLPTAGEVKAWVRCICNTARSVCASPSSRIGDSRGCGIAPSRPAAESKRMTAPDCFRVPIGSPVSRRPAPSIPLLDDPGPTRRGGQQYFDCGEVILALVDVAAGGKSLGRPPGSLLRGLRSRAVLARAKARGASRREDPRGRRRRDQETPLGRALVLRRGSVREQVCFVDDRTTLFTGKNPDSERHARTRPRRTPISSTSTWPAAISKSADAGRTA